MKINLLTVLTLGLFITNCNTKPNDKSENKEIETFTETDSDSVTNINLDKEDRLHYSLTQWNKLYDTLTKTELPIEFNQKKWRKDYIRTFYKKLGQNSIPSSFPVTILSENKNYISIIIVVDDLPVLVTYDKDKKPIDELFILDDYGMNPTKDITEFARINTDLTINLIDSIYTYKLDESERWIQDSQEFSRTVNNFKIDDRGKIKKMD
jgi:hypothetical protein